MVSPRKCVPVDLPELVGVFDDASFEHEYFLDCETGDVEFVSDFMDEDDREEIVERIDAAPVGRYLRIPHADSREGYRDMEAFIETVKDDRLQERLWTAINGRGAFPRFKDVLLDDAKERERWFAFQDERLRERVYAWLQVEGIEPIPRPRGSSEGAS